MARRTPLRIPVGNGSERSLLLLVLLLPSCGRSDPVEVTGQRTSLIAFVSDRDGNEEVYVMQADGSQVRNLTAHPSRDSDPCWSPDGKRIAFQSDRNGSEQIYIMSADGSGATKLTSGPGKKAMTAWSPNGGQIAFSVEKESEVFVCLASAEGGEPKRVIDGMAPSWSPDGRTIAFNRGQLPHIWLMDSDGENLRRFGAADESKLTREEQFDLLFRLAPVWSPDGQRLLYTKASATPGGPKPGMNYEVFTADLQDRDRQRLTTNEARDMGHAWSPDGTKIAFSSDRDGNMEIYVMNTDGSEPVNVTNSKGRDRSAAWSPFLSK